MREKWIDFEKGIAIYSVVLGHSIQYIYCHNESMEDNCVFLFIYSFHMALFAMISGYLLYYSARRYSLIEGVVRKVETILVPCLVWGGIEYFYTLLRGWNCFSIYNCILFLLNHNWFLWSVFYCSIIIFLLNYLIGSVKNLAGLLIIVGAMFCPDFLNSIDFKMMFPAYFVGYCVNDKRLLQKYKAARTNTKLIIFMGIVFIYIVLMLFVIDKNDIMYWQYYLGSDRVHNFENLIKRLAVNLIGSSMVVLSLMYIFGRIHALRFTYIVARLGKNSLGIYMVQSIVFGYGLGILYRFSSMSTLFRGVATAVLSGIITIGSWLVVNLLKKNKLAARIFLGVTE